ncbi:MAG: hydantoinase B/oxoprolinase family protein [Vulcanimicrobiota bacterium]
MSVDAFSLSVFRSLFEGIAEEMGSALARSAFSPNIRERLDFSCALFDPVGQLVAQAAHIPVHLGSMPDLVAELAQLPTQPGDVLAANDPYAGGTHLPDITLVAPCYRHQQLIGWAAARAHHADVGGMTPGSMPVSREIFQEGLRIPPVYLFRAGQRQEDLWRLILANVRTPDEREGDLLAQLAACHTAARRLDELVDRYGLDQVLAHQQALLDYSQRLTEEALSALPAGQASAEDVLELAGQTYPVRVRVVLEERRARLDFAGSAPCLAGPLNAPLPVTKAAVYYVFRCLLGDHIPANQGAFRPLVIEAEPGTVVRATPPAAVVAGNVETSQRIVDVVWAALAQLLPEVAPAASAGTMNNLAMGGEHQGRPFAYYETMGGGCGASAAGSGEHGVQVHMTNTRNTPAEALESEMPLRIRHYGLRRGSGGEGKHRGGDGICRVIEFLAPARVSLLSSRRLQGPPGANGGGPGLPGRQLRTRDGEEVELPGQFQEDFLTGDVLRLETPGGGGWGAPE